MTVAVVLAVVLVVWLLAHHLFGRPAASFVGYPLTATQIAMRRLTVAIDATAAAFEYAPAIRRATAALEEVAAAIRMARVASAPADRPKFCEALDVCRWPDCDCDCDCLIPALEGAGQHSPGCRCVKR